jgi:hypothetical protein
MPSYAQNIRTERRPPRQQHPPSSLASRCRRGRTGRPSPAGRRDQVQSLSLVDPGSGCSARRTSGVVGEASASLNTGLGRGRGSGCDPSRREGVTPGFDYGVKAADLQHDAVVVEGRVTVIEPGADALEQVSGEGGGAPSHHLWFDDAAVEGDQVLGVLADDFAKVVCECGEGWFVGCLAPQQAKGVGMASRSPG